jgi:hypothetical protein
MFSKDKYGKILVPIVTLFKDNGSMTLIRVRGTLEKIGEFL